MATRLYFEPTDPGITPAADGGWTRTADMVRCTLARAKTASTNTATGSTSGASSATSAIRQAISQAIAAQTITGTVSFVSRAFESAADDNVNAAITAVKVISGDGSTVRGTLRAIGEGGGNSELNVSAFRGRSHLVNASVTSVAAQAGDKLMVEFGYGHTSAVSGTSVSFDNQIGGNGTDHANTNLDNTGTVPWIEFSFNIVFMADLAATLSVSATLSAGAIVENPVAATMDATATLSAGAIVDNPIAASLSVTATLAADATVETGAKQIEGQLAVTATLAAAGVVDNPIAAQLAGVATLTSGAVLTTPVGATLAATATLLAGVLLQAMAAASQAATATLLANADVQAAYIPAYITVDTTARGSPGESRTSTVGVEW